jgi:hypothetical protein
MSNDSYIPVNKSTLEKILKLKNEYDPEKNLSQWLTEFFDYVSVQIHKDKSTLNIIENIFEKNLYEKYYDDWIKNFTLNLENIWNGNSARDLTPISKNDDKISAIVIGRGPSIYKYKHLEMLAQSNFNGSIICTDGALISALKAGVTPDKFKNFFVLTIDTQEHIRNLYNDEIVQQHGNKIKCILSTTVSITTCEIAKKLGMEVFWLHALFDYDKGKSSFNYIANVMTKIKKHQKGLPAIQTGGNVGTAAWVVSWSILKCSPIVLLGIDHGYPAEMSWEEIDKYHKIPNNISQNSEAFKRAYPTIYNPEFNCYVKQDPIFQYYSNALKEFIPKAPSWVKTINATGGGAIFGNGITCMKFEQFLAQLK